MLENQLSEAEATARYFTQQMPPAYWGEVDTDARNRHMGAVATLMPRSKYDDEEQVRVRQRGENRERGSVCLVSVGGEGLKVSSKDKTTTPSRSTSSLSDVTNEFRLDG